MSHHDDQQASRLAGLLYHWKGQWEQGRVANRADIMDNARAQAAQVREQLRALGYGWIADALGADNATAEMAKQYINNGLGKQLWNWYGFTPDHARGVAPGTTPALSLADGMAGRVIAPVSGGTPGSGGGQAPVLPSANTQPDNAPTGATPVGLAATVTGAISNVATAVSSGIQTGASGTGAAAGGLAQTVYAVARPLIAILLPVLAIITIGKVLRLRLNVGGKGGH